MAIEYPENKKGRIIKIDDENYSDFIDRVARQENMNDADKLRVALTVVVLLEEEINELQRHPSS